MSITIKAEIRKALNDIEIIKKRTEEIRKLTQEIVKDTYGK